MVKSRIEGSTYTFGNACRSTTYPLAGATIAISSRALPSRWRRRISLDGTPNSFSRSSDADTIDAAPSATPSMELFESDFGLTRGEQVFVFRADQVGTVDRENRLALFHVLPGLIGEDAADPSRKTRLHIGGGLLVGLDGAGGADAIDEVLLRDSRELQPDKLLTRGRNQNRRQLRLVLRGLGRGERRTL